MGGVDRAPITAWRPSLLQVSLVVMVGSVVWFLLRWAYPFGPPVLGWLLPPLSPLLGMIAAARVARGRALTPPARRVWNCLACGSLVLTLATLCLMYDSLTGPGAPRQRTSPLTIVLSLLAIIIPLWGAVRLPVRRRSRREWLTVSLDIGIVVVATGLILAYVTARYPQGRDPAWITVLLCALLGVLVTIKASLTGFTGIDHSAMRVLALATLLGTLLGGTTPMLAARPDLNSSMLALPVAYIGLVIAAELQSRAPRRRRTVRRRRLLPFSLVPYAAIVATDALLLVAVRETTTATTTAIMIVGSVVLTGLVIVRQMIAFFDNRRYQDQLAHRASHDELTDLANRTLFNESSERAVASGPPGTVAVAVIDLDDFKSINDRLGHTVGDALLTAVGARLRGCVRPDDTVARLGGDEYAILLENLRPGDSTAIAERVLHALTEPVRAAGHDLLIQASIGLADNSSETRADDLLRRADMAMYAAKELGKNRQAHYDADMDARTVEHAELAAELSRALDRNELHMLYQPIVDLATGRLVGVEALVRWEHPRNGLVSPARFIPVAERTGLILPIGAWVLRTACEQAADWQRRLGARAPERLTVNVSARQLLDPAFPQTVATVLAETGLDPSRLTVEITETAVFGGGRAVEAVAAIHAMGVGIALDDFGTGHSSLGLLRTCPVNVLKVDKSFVDDVGGVGGQAAVTTAIIEIAQALGLRAIAEGVETAAQAERLQELGYQLAQGYYFARPLSPSGVETLLDREDRVVVIA